MRSAVAFLTPFGGARTPDQRTMNWFPVVGAAIGAVVGGAWWAADRVWPPVVVGAVAVVVDLICTGMLHMDGLADSADGLVAHMDRDRRLAVMSDPTVGAFGVVVLVAVLLLRFAAFAALPVDVALVAALWCASRTLMALTARVLPYARSEGLASAFAGEGWVGPAAVGGVLTLALAGWSGLHAVAAVIVGLAAGALVVLLGRVRLGGYTGDVLGAAGVITETVGLLVAAIRW